MRISVLSAERICEIRMIEDIEKLHPELGSETLTKFPVLGYRKVDVAKSGVAEDVAAHSAESPQRGRDQQRLSAGIAAETG